MVSEKWELVSLNELGKIISGKPFSKKIIFISERKNFPFVGAKEIGENRLFIFGGDRRYNINSLREDKLFPKNTVCIARYGSQAGSSALLSQDSFISISVFALSLNARKGNENDPKFTKYCFDYSKIKIKLFSVAKIATAQPGLHLHKFSFIKEFPKPPLWIQQKIGNILANYDLILDNHEKQIKLLKELKKSLFREWFVKLRFPDYEKYSIENEIPKGWKKIRFGDLTKVQIGRKPASHSELLDGLGKYPFFTCSTKTKKSYTFSYDFPSLLVSGGAITVSFMMGSLKRAPTFLFRN